MSDTRCFDWRRFARAALSLILALCLCLSVLPTTPVSASAQDDALNKLVDWGVMSGYPDGGMHPERAITRAEFLALVNRAYGYHETGNTPFVDVPENAWYADDVSIAYNARYFDGTTTTTASPTSSLTREQAMTLLARGMRLDSVAGEVTEFSDGRDFGSWSRGYVKAAYQKGVIGGYKDGTFKPKKNINRGEMAILLSRALGNLVYEQGEHSLGSVYGNVTINTSNVTLYDTTIAGDLYITGGLGLGSVTLENVRVLGSIVVAGGGESEAGEDSVVLRNVAADELRVDSLARQYLSVRAEGETVVSQTVVRTDAYIQDRTQAGEGLLNISLEGLDSNTQFTLAGNLENVVNKSPNSSLKISRGTLGSLTIDEAALGSSLSIDGNATVKTLNLDTAVAVTGRGDVGTLNVNAEGASASMLPDNIYIRPGITASVYNETMDTTLGEEASSAPHILAGYPKASDVAPTNMTATLATNKSGTLYWAVSSITDGSVGEQELISPASYGSKAVKSGTLSATASKTDLTVTVPGLTTGGNYYFSAILVDARGDRSPVKVIAFSTPDNTVPAFASGYPTSPPVTNSYDPKGDAETKYFTEFGIRATKSCNLYWALFTKGSTAPTAAEFRSGSLAGKVQSGVREVERNEDVLLTVKGLAELTDYDIYFWLNDFDGVKSSAVRKVTFKTVDGTPPQFNLIPTMSAQPKATSLSLTTNVNEAATVYWVAVLAGTDYPKGKPAGNSLTEEEYAILQVANGINGLKSGKVTVRANTDATINITGLTAETAYDIWYVAMDTAGNYSTFVYKAGAANPNYVTVHTLDTSSPKVTQEFSNVDSTGKPYPDTDIRLVFSEDVLRLSHVGKDGDVTLLSFKDKTSDQLKEFFDSVITFKYITDQNKKEPVPPAVFANAKFSVKQDTDGRRVILTISGLDLGSGSTYFFELTDLADISVANNPMGPPDPYVMEQFTTVSSKVVLNALGSLTSIDPSKVGWNKTANWSGAVPTSSIPIDIAFTMTPEATSKEDASKDWDMLIWANTSVEFELYRRELPNGVADDSILWERLPGKVYIPGDDSTGDDSTGDDATGGDATDGDASAGGASTRDSSADVSVQRTGTATINLNTDQTNAGTFLGLTLFQNFEFDTYADGSAIVTNHKLNELHDGGTVFEYGIHIVRVESSDQRGSWSKEVTFQFNVVAGTNLLNDLTRKTINQGNYDTAIAGDVDDITEALRARLPFRLTVPFDDTSAPTFSNNFPYFNRSDTYLDMTVQLSRPGTVYWVVTPIGSPTNSSVTNLAIDPTRDSYNQPVRFDWYDASKGNINLESAVNDTDLIITPNEADETYLLQPTSDRIYRPSNDANEKIIIGSQTVSSFATTIRIPNLTPSTGYFVYLVLQGKGPDSYSPRVMLYKVATTPPDRPIITLTNPNGDSVVNIRTADKDDNDMDTNVNYLLILNTDDALNSNMIRLNEKLGDEGNHIADISEADLKAYGDLTLLEAMDKVVKDPNNQNYPKGTVFDLYAHQDVKDRIEFLITGSASGSGDLIAGGDSVDIPLVTGGGNNAQRQYTVPVDCSKHGISFGSEYVFLATARNVQGSDRAFSAYYPVADKDTEAPAVENILQTLQVIETGNGTYSISGDITLVFDKELYWWNTSTRKTILVDTAPSNATASVTRKSIIDISSGNGISVVTDMANAGVPTNEVKLRLSSAISGSSISFNSYLCNSSGTYNTSVSRSVTVTIEKINSMDYLVISPRDWKNNPSPNTYRWPITIVGQGHVTGVTLNPSSLTLTLPNGHSALTATITPANVDDSNKGLVWASSNNNVATVNPWGGVDAVGPGTCMITVTTQDGGYTASCVVTVTDSKWSFNLSPKTLEFEVGGIGKALKATVIASDGANHSVTWSSDDTGVATVSPTTGDSTTVTPVAAGKTTITARVSAYNGQQTETLTCTVTVTGPSVSVPDSASVSSAITAEGITIPLTITNLSPSMIQEVVWHSTNDNIITFGKNNKTAVYDVRRAGDGVSGKSADIYAVVRTYDGKSYTSNHCTVTVK